jgi:hypothetical protein
MADPAFTRRALLRVGVVAGAGAVVAVDAPGAAAATRRARKVLGLAEFKAQVGSTFTVRDAAGQGRALRLTEARGTPMVTDVRGSGEVFSLVFREKRGRRMPSGTYRLRHPVLGELELFLQPFGRGQDYEAVVNRWRPAS